MATNRLQFFKKHGIPETSSLSLPKIAKLSGIPIAALKEVQSRGRGAYSSNPTSVRTQGTFEKNASLSAVPLSGRLSMAQWAMARVYSFVNKGKGTYYGADADIRKKYGV
jgi:hypothetical protein